MGKKDIEKIADLIKSRKKSFIDEAAQRSKSKATKNRKVTLSLPEDVVKTLWIIKAERGYSSISQIVAEAVRKFSMDLD